MWFARWYQEEFDPNVPEHVEKLRMAAEGWEFKWLAADLYADYLLRIVKDYAGAANWYCIAASEGENGDVLSYLRSLPDKEIYLALERDDIQTAIQRLTDYFYSLDKQ